jgi:hypothetical protein
VVLNWNLQEDEWQTFEMEDKRFAIYFTYEDELFVGVYDDGDGIHSPYPTSFKLTHKDEF